jgi:acetyl-CoA acetyltransferase family protein
MSSPTLTFPRKGEEFFIRASRARSLSQKLSLLAKFRPGFLAPQAPSPKEPSTGLTMGQHCELMAQEFGIARTDQDALAFRSHHNAACAWKEGLVDDQILPLGDVRSDNLVRADTSLEKLASLPAVFDRGPKGSITAGNASALTDGASALCIMEDEFARAHAMPILGHIEAIEYASVPPGDGLLMGPALALPRLMQRCGWSVDSVDIFEIHEAFGAQVLCNMEAWRHGWSRYSDLQPLGEIPAEKMNVLGGSIALGHPFAATGGRLLLNACKALKVKGGTRAVISVCAAGGGAAAVAITTPAAQPPS